MQPSSTINSLPPMKLRPNETSSPVVTGPVGPGLSVGAASPHGEVSAPRAKIKLGPFEIDHPFILAPMAGICNSPYRRLMRRMQSSVMISELISANGMEYAGERTLSMLKYHDEERLIGFQIFGEDTERLCGASRHIERTGADFVDLNLGCPVPKVVNKGAGSAMCRNPRELGKTLSAMVKAVKIPVTIKIRTGWDANSRNAIEVVRAAADAGVAWVAIHGRTRAQGYSGEADWDFIGDVKAKSPIPILGNGDLNTPPIAVERFRKYGVDAVLIGRGALRNPFIFEESAAIWRGEAYAPPTLARFQSLLNDQRVLLNESFIPRMAMVHARKFLAWYSAGYPGCHEFRKKVFTIAEPDALWAEAHDFFARSLEGRDMGFLAQPFLMGGHG
ncbi:MAG: tRNA dihydrouridine synthase DusB [Bacteriovoracia bacterium]